MRFELQKLDAGQVCIPIAILEKDLDEMWNRFDSGMCDLTTGNAVALAINRTLGLESPVRVVTDASTDDFYCVLKKRVIPLPSEISIWLSRCLRGMREKPIRFGLWLPRCLVTESNDNAFPFEEKSEESIAA